MWASKGRVFQAAGIACAKVLRQGLVLKEQGEAGASVIDQRGAERWVLTQDLVDQGEDFAWFLLE